VNVVSSESFRYIVRICSTDVDGTKKLAYAVSHIKGINVNLAKAVSKVAGVDPDIRIGFLDEVSIKKIEAVLKDPIKYGFPSWLLNRRKDISSGKDLHLIGPDLSLQEKSDIDLMKEIKSWKGVRHSLGLTVRGQKTRTTGRFGRAVGVKKEKRIQKARAEKKE